MTHNQIIFRDLTRLCDENKRDAKARANQAYRHELNNRRLIAQQERRNRRACELLSGLFYVTCLGLIFACLIALGLFLNIALSQIAGAHEAGKSFDLILIDRSGDALIIDHDLTFQDCLGELNSSQVNVDAILICEATYKA